VYPFPGRTNDDAPAPENAVEANAAEGDATYSGDGADAELTAAADAALADVDEADAPMGPCLVVYGKDEGVQFFPYNPETDVIAIGKQSELVQLALSDVQQVELGIVG